MTCLLIESSEMGTFILLMVFFGVIVPVLLFIIGLVMLSKNKKRGKIILIIAAVYSIISLGLCSGTIGF